MSDYVLTAKVGDNSDLFPDILKLYVPASSYVLDMTYGNGVFWKKVDPDLYIVYRNDIDPERGDVHYDFRDLPVMWGDKFEAVVLDPPYLHVGGFKTMKKSLDQGYNNMDRALKMGIVGSKAVHELYYAGMSEAHRVLKSKGILILKCQDQIESGKQQWSHVIYMDYADKLGFRSVDLFVMVMNHQPLMRHKPENQKHARRNHSYFLVFRKEKT